MTSASCGKQVKVTPLGLDFYLTVVESIKRLGKLPLGGRSKQARNWYVKRLIQEGIIHKIGYGVWEVDEQKWSDFQQVKQVKVTPYHTPPGVDKTFTFHTQSRGVRGHGFQFILKLPVLKNWDRRKDFLRSRQIDFSVLKARGVYHQLFIQQFKVWLCQKSVIIYFPRSLDILEETASESKRMAFLKVLEIIRELEDVLETSFRIAGKYQVRLVKQHYADPNNILARRMDDDGQKLHLIGEDGKTWLLIDCSTGMPELECVHPVEAVRDMDEVVMAFFKDLRLHPVLPGEILAMQSGALADHLALSVIVKQLIEAVNKIDGR